MLRKREGRGLSKERSDQGNPDPEEGKISPTPEIKSRRRSYGRSRNEKREVLV